MISDSIAQRLLPAARAAAVLCASLATLGSMPVQASSHREAPFISTVPKVDGTDFYMFNSYEAGRGAFVTLIANYLPLQDPYGGPNYFPLDPNALYEIHLDNNGDAKEDITFQFRFQNVLKAIALPINGVMVPIPLIQAGIVSTPNSPNLNLNEKFTLNIVRGDRRTGVVAAVTAATSGKGDPASPMPAVAAARSTSRSTTSAPRPFPTTRVTRPSTSTTSAFPAAACPARCSWASARTRSPSTWGRSSTWSTCRSRSSPTRR